MSFLNPHPISCGVTTLQPTARQPRRLEETDALLTRAAKALELTGISLAASFLPQGLVNGFIFGGVRAPATG